MKYPHDDDLILFAFKPVGCRRDYQFAGASHPSDPSHSWHLPQQNYAALKNYFIKANVALSSTNAVVAADSMALDQASVMGMLSLNFGERVSLSRQSFEAATPTTLYLSPPAVLERESVHH